MINNSEFAARLTTIMNYYQLSASAFADKVQVPRSSISHLLSGRNKPSLDFVLKVINEFDEIELYWLLNGKGSFPQPGSPAQVKGDNPQTEDQPTNRSIQNNPEKHPSVKRLERIVLFYTDGTFKEYHQ